jgi:D-methionine transport system ATP-binding protein
MTERIRVEGLSKDFVPRKGRTVSALKDIDLTVEAGEIYGLIGRSGAGKSTLLRMINRLEHPTSGRVFVDGTDLSTLTNEEMRQLRHRIGMVFQQFSLWNSRTVYGNIAVPLKLAGWKDEAITKRVSELIDFVGLGGKAFVRPRQLSGGQKQRVGIARAIATRPSILLSDEATSALDPQTTTEIVDLLRATNREFGITIVVVTHEMDVISQLADRVSILHHGEVVEVGDIHQVLAHPRHPVSAGIVASYTGTTLTDVERKELAEAHDGRNISVVVDERLLDGPVLTRLARKAGIDFSVVQGGVSRVKNKPYGLLSLVLYGDDLATESFIEELSGLAEVTRW